MINTKVSPLKVINLEEDNNVLNFTIEKINVSYVNVLRRIMLSNVPIILNTSFNENEPIVMSPKEAINCFLRTDMDILVLNNYIIKR